MLYKYTLYTPLSKTLSSVMNEEDWMSTNQHFSAFIPKQTKHPKTRVLVVFLKFELDEGIGTSAPYQQLSGVQRDVHTVPLYESTISLPLY